MYADPRGPRCIMRYLFVKFDDVRDLRDPGRPPVTIQVRPLYIGIRLVSIDNTRDNRRNNDNSLLLYHNIIISKDT